MTEEKKRYIVTIARRDPAAEAKNAVEPEFWKKKEAGGYEPGRMGTFVRRLRQMLP